MASWERLRCSLRENYRTNRDDLDAVGMVVEGEDGRSQQVLVRKLSLGDQEWAEIATAVCRADEIDPRAALSRNGRMIVGSLALVGSFVVFRHTLPLADLDSDEFETSLRLAVGFGEMLERELSGHARGGGIP
jgi:hypothetical protein